MHRFEVDPIKEGEETVAWAVVEAVDKKDAGRVAWPNETARKALSVRVCTFPLEQKKDAEKYAKECKTSRLTPDGRMLK